MDPLTPNQEADSWHCPMKGQDVLSSEEHSDGEPDRKHSQPRLCLKAAGPSRDRCWVLGEPVKTLTQDEARDQHREWNHIVIEWMSEQTCGGGGVAKLC